MIQFIRFMNKSNNAVEVENRPVHVDYAAQKWDVFRINQDYLVNGLNEGLDSGNFYCCLESVGPYDAERNIKCFRITPDMLFRTEAREYLSIGTELVFSSNNSLGGLADMAPRQNEAAADAIVVDTITEGTKRYAIVRFLR